jgi:hypothetical protein
VPSDNVVTTAIGETGHLGPLADFSEETGAYFG